MSCSKKEMEFEGDLYFKLIDFGSLYGADDKTIQEFEWSLDSIRNNKNNRKDDLELLRYFDVLKANDLHTSPYIYLRTDSGNKRIYLSVQEYEKLKKFDRHKLVVENQKVKLIIKVTELDSGIYYSDNISEIKLTDGATYWSK